MTSREKFEIFLVGEYEWGEGALNAAFFQGDDETGYYTGGDFIYHGEKCGEALSWAWCGWKAAEAELAVQLANAESKCRELAAENAHARERHIFIRALAVSILEHSGGRMDWRGAMEDATELLQTVDSVYAKTPATDAFLAEVRTSARNDFIGRIEWIIRNECNPDKTEAIINELQNFSEELKLEAAQ